MAASDTSLSGQGSSDQLYALNRSSGNSLEENGFTGGASLSMDFSAPLTDQARAERIKQMSKNHVCSFPHLPLLHRAHQLMVSPAGL